MRRTVPILALALLLPAAGCAGGVSGPQAYAVDLDAPSPQGEKLQVSAYFPGALRVSPGDTIVFRNRSTEAPHTVTFGVAADRSNQPQLLTPTGENPVAFGACYSEDNPTPDLAKCPHAELPDYGGTGYWNSGVLQPMPAPDQAGAKDVLVSLTADIAPGEYAFVCVLHPFMNGTIEVLAEEADRTAPEEVTEAASRAAEDALTDAQGIEEPDLVREADTVTVSAGWGDRVTSVNRYGPAELEVKAGTAVQWVTRSPYEPHTVTFASTFEQPADPASFQPGGVKSGSDYTGGFANSGLLGPEGGPFSSEPFVLKFTKAGAYSYQCTLHPGQTGVVNVTQS